MHEASHSGLLSARHMPCTIARPEHSGEFRMGTLGLEQRVVVITGASSGFGKGAALAFADHGAWPVIAARRSELLDKLAGECQQRCGHALAVPTDVSRREDVEQLL